MPLLHRKPFQRLPPPPDLEPDELVFLCKTTREAFRSYDDFFERTILCNSLVWSCSLTGRSSLTYLEALESEQRARLSVKSFPTALLQPLLHLVAAGRHCRLHDLCQHVYTYTKERFFPGESVRVSECSGARHLCEVLEVRAGPSNGCRTPPGGDTIIISDSDEDSAPIMHLNGSKKPLSPSAFRYSVRKMDNSETLVVRHSQISRKKNMLSRERLKLLFKHYCEPHNGTIVLKRSAVLRFALDSQSFSQFFPEEPNFSFSPPTGGHAHPVTGSPDQHQMQRMTVAAQERSKLKKEERQHELKKREKEEKEVLKEELKRRFEEERERRRQEKDRMKEQKEKEREKLKEEKRRFAEQLKQWNKPREDLECDDLKELPPPLPVRTRLPAQVFGDALMVVEFLRAFGDLFDLQDEFPDGVSLEVLEEALVGSDPEGPLCELLFFFLSAIFQALEEEEEEEEQLSQEASEAAEEECDQTLSAVNAVEGLAASWPQLYQGCSLQQLDLDSCSLSEILRLHILAAGADCNHANAKYRYQKQGGLLANDDPCVELRAAHPALLRKLACTSVYDLVPGEKLQLLGALAGKLLTLVSTRELMEQSAEEQRAARHEVREIRAEQHRREREEAAYRVRLRKEEKLKEQELRMKEKERRIKEEEQRSVQDEEQQMEEEEQHTVQRKKAQQQEDPSESSPAFSLTVQELQKEQEKVRELQDRIQRAASYTSVLPLGRDRLYRRYWLFPWASALFVEEDEAGAKEELLPPPEEEEEEEEERAPPLIRPNQWAFYGSVQEVERLIEALNPRGHRENGLREALLQERERLHQQLDNSAAQCYNLQVAGGPSAPAENFLENRLRDLLLDLEDRIYQGTLGELRVMDRAEWRAALEESHYELLCCDGHNGGMDGGVEPPRDRLQVVLGGSGNVGPRQAVSDTVRCLARALFHIEQGIDKRFLKAPLGDEDSKKEQKIKKSKRKDEERSSDAGSDGGRVSRTVLERWRESLLCCSSLSQVFVHLSSLDSSVLWSRSLLNARCRMCRRKGSAEDMLLCHACHRGHHTHCLRPRLKNVPEGDWFCPECRPKQRARRLSSFQPSFSSEEEEESDEEGEESDMEEDESDDDEGGESEEEEGESDEEEASEEEESDEEAARRKKKSQSAVRLPPRSKGSKPPARQQSTPKSASARPRNTPKSTSARRRSSPKSTSARQRSTPKNTSANGKPAPASRSSGKKAPPSKAARTPDGRTEQHKRPASEPLLPVLTPSCSSSSRRSSGRSHGVHQLSACEQLTVELVRHQDSWPFIKLVSRTQVPDYYDVISKPIALSVIREKVNNCQYETAAEYIEDVERMFSNCMQYNARHSLEARAGVRLQSFFQAELVRRGLGQISHALPKRSRQ